MSITKHQEILSQGSLHAEFLTFLLTLLACTSWKVRAIAPCHFRCSQIFTKADELALHGQRAQLLGLWQPALSADSAGQLDIRKYLANPSQGWDIETAAEMWWRASALEALQAFILGPLTSAGRAGSRKLQESIAALLAPTLEIISSTPPLQVCQAGQRAKACVFPTLCNKLTRSRHHNACEAAQVCFHLRSPCDHYALHLILYESLPARVCLLMQQGLDAPGHGKDATTERKIIQHRGAMKENLPCRTRARLKRGPDQCLLRRLRSCSCGWSRPT